MTKHDERARRAEYELCMQKAEKYNKLCHAILDIIDVAYPYSTQQYVDADKVHKEETSSSWLVIKGDIKSLLSDSEDNYEHMADERTKLIKIIEERKENGSN